jgi:hypothetical protein
MGARTWTLVATGAAALLMVACGRSPSSVVSQDASAVDSAVNPTFTPPFPSCNGGACIPGDACNCGCGTARCMVDGTWGGCDCPPPTCSGTCPSGSVPLGRGLWLSCCGSCEQSTGFAGSFAVGDSGACPLGSAPLGGCCGTCEQSADVAGAFAVDDAGACPPGAAKQGNCCFFCSDLGGVLPPDDSGPCPGNLVLDRGCCAQRCSEYGTPMVGGAPGPLRGGTGRDPSDSGLCHDGYAYVEAARCCYPRWDSGAPAARDASAVTESEVGVPDAGVETGSDAAIDAGGQ